MENYYTTGHEGEFYNYDLQIYPNGFFNDFVDIGGCYGTISFMMAQRNPAANICCYEPCDWDFKVLKEKALVFPNISVFNEALGNGEDLFFEQRKTGQHTFVEGGGTYSKPSKTLEEIFDCNNIDINNSSYGIKIDCEGGERFLLNDKDIEEIIRKSQHLAMEIHFDHENLQRNLWFKRFPNFVIYNEWIYDNFDKTHNIKYHKSNRRSGIGVYVLTNKEHGYENV
jgi:FkbM family methyltransferase